jgi:hypothetical protein
MSSPIDDYILWTNDNPRRGESSRRLWVDDEGYEHLHCSSDEDMASEPEHEPIPADIPSSELEREPILDEIPSERAVGGFAGDEDNYPTAFIGTSKMMSVQTELISQPILRNPLQPIRTLTKRNKLQPPLGTPPDQRKRLQRYRSTRGAR